MKCFFCNEEDDPSSLDYSSFVDCFNCGRELCGNHSGATEKVSGDLRGYFCQYCRDIRNYDTIPININAISQWAETLNALLNDISSEPLRKTIVKIFNDMKSLIPEIDETI